MARHAPVPLGALARDAVRRAAADAALDLRRVDGLCVDLTAALPGVDGIDFVSQRHLAAALDLRGLRWSAAIAAGSFVGAVVEAVHAVASGACAYAVAWKAMRNPPPRPGSGPGAPGPPGPVEPEAALLAAYGLGGSISAYAFPYSRYMARYGVGREQLATLVVNSRRNAAMNPDAVFFQRPIGEMEYLSSRMIVEPLSLLDCDMPVDGCGAVIVTSVARAAGHVAPAYVAGHASFVQPARPTLVLTPERMHEDARRLGRALWTSSGLRPRDVDQAELYDGFSWLVYPWLEGLGFCGPGEAPRFIQDGRIEIGGELPLNTSGGSLGTGRLHGPAHVIEAVRQVQGRAGPRQVAGADLTLAVTGQPSASPGAMLFGRSPI